MMPADPLLAVNWQGVLGLLFLLSLGLAIYIPWFAAELIARVKSNRICASPTCGRSMSLFDRLLERKVCDPCRQRLAAERHTSEARIQSATLLSSRLRVNYEEYIRSAEWRSVVARVRQRSHGVCERCGRGKHENTHHLTYSRLGAELMEDVIGVCTGCHRYLHSLSPNDPRWSAADES